MGASAAVFWSHYRAVVGAARSATGDDHTRRVGVDTQTAVRASLGPPATVLLIASPAEDF